MGLFDFVKKATDALSEIDPTNPNSALNESLTEIDPTNPDAEYGEITQFVGDAALNFITDGASGTAFSDGSQFILDLNDATDNAFTINSIEDAISDIDFDVNSVTDY